MRAELGQLGVPVSPEKTDGEEAAWEAELQQELSYRELIWREEREVEREPLGGSEEAWEAGLVVS